MEDAVVLVILFVALLAVSAAPLRCWWLYRRRREALWREFGPRLHGLRVERVGLARPQWLRSWRMLWMWWCEVPALLAHDAHEIRLLARLADGSLIDQRHSRADLSLRWYSASEASRWSPLCWIALGQSPLLLLATEPPGGLLLGQRAQAADLYARLAPAGTALPARSDFDLLKNRAAALLVVAFFGLLAYAAIDRFSYPHQLVGSYRGLKSLLVFLLPLLLMPVSVLLRRAGLPHRESYGLPVLLGVALGFAVIPAIKHIDAVWAPADFAEYRCALGDKALLTCDAGVPELRFANLDDYWAQFAAGSIHMLRLRRGALGLWQFDPAPLQQKVDAWRKAQGKRWRPVRLRD